MNSSHSIALKAQKISNYNEYAEITGIILYVDDETYYLAGTEDGTVLEAECPYATQEMTDTLLNALGGYVYQSIRADTALVTPTAELGDEITVNGVTTILGYQNIIFSSGSVMDVEAPGGSETEHEYQVSTGYTTQSFNRKIAETKSLISKTASEIRLEVEGLSGDFEDYKSELAVSLEGITASLTSRDDRITALEMFTGSLSLTVQNYDDSAKITLSVTDEDGSSIDLAAQYVTFTGYVTFNDLSGEGSTVINGSNITTGTISAERLYLTGAITWSSLSTSLQENVSDISDTASNALAAAENAQESADDAAGAASSASALAKAIANGTYSGTFIDGTTIYSPCICGDEIELWGGTFKVLNKTASTLYGYIGHGTGNNGDTITDGIIMSRSGYSNLSTGDYYIICTSSGVRLQAGQNSLFITNNLAAVVVDGVTYNLASMPAVFG